MKTWKHYLLVLITPSCWLQTSPYSQAWDIWLQAALLTRKWEPVDEYTAKIAGLEVWIANHPYGSMRIYDAERLYARPSRSTILYARERLLEDIPTQAK